MKLIPHIVQSINTLPVTSLNSLTQLLPLICLYMSNPALTVPLCRATVRPQLCLLQLLLPNCVHFSCCSPVVSILQLLLPECICFSCCSLIVSTSTAVPCVRFTCMLLPDCVRFTCRYLIASALPAATQLCPLQLPIRFQSLLVSVCLQDYNHFFVEFTKLGVCIHAKLKSKGHEPLGRTSL